MRSCISVRRRSSLLHHTASTPSLQYSPFQLLHAQASGILCYPCPMPLFSRRQSHKACVCFYRSVYPLTVQFLPFISACLKWTPSPPSHWFTLLKFISFRTFSLTCQNLFHQAVWHNHSLRLFTSSSFTIFESQFSLQGPCLAYTQNILHYASFLHTHEF